ncbi:uncharacterized shell protein 1-like [Saccostrea echinata]|uniref:uncharacterized shell protein 1-like n=1 Tax=Saccostrea echinata TaxID=191078 RepID=UPI002A81651B|nr:uncharacterized shell protein 1-like [Saccostrea echinata]
MAVVYAKRPNYANQGRSKLQVCRLDCIYDSVMCAAPCRLLFRSSRTGYLSCARDCGLERRACFYACANAEKQAHVQTPELQVVTQATRPTPKPTHGGHVATHTAHAAKQADHVEVDGQETGESNESVED